MMGFVADDCEGFAKVGSERVGEGLVEMGIVSALGIVAVGGRANGVEFDLGIEIADAGNVNVF